MNTVDIQRVQRLVDLAMYTPRYTYPMYVNAPRPKDPEFASVGFVSEDNPGFDKQEVIDNGDGTFTIRTTGVREVIFDVMFTRGQDAVSEFVSSFYRQDMLNMMVSQDMSVLGCTPIENATLTLETNWEIRNGVRLVALTRRVYEHTTGTIELTEIDWCVNEATHEVCGTITTEDKDL